ncbi:hypothetical protein AB7321_20735 [Providencia rettgeri]|uniref:Uncharacterized protein n=1 Tax=Providencia rettgeri TaxID=587 RepID=A0AAW6ULV1_PRORE|nr:MULTISPECIES: hypothetical protein [Providencia]MDI9095022.1 hypothetical protein [Providencia rettgeri]
MQDGVAVIRVNNIEVGSMPISQYEEIVMSVKQDWRTRVAVVFGYVGFFWKFIIRLWSYFVQSFAIIIAVSMLYFFSHPAETTQFVTELRNASSETIAEGIRSVANICFFLTVIACTLSFFIKGIPAFVSVSENAINKKIREVMEVPAEGPVSITFKRDGLNSVR